MPSITVPHKFFTDERKKLYNWEPDYWRELLQNSIDAGARFININIENNDGSIVCTTQDDGCGMTREVLDNVYFALGETTKKDSSSIGGFGRARIMTCFGHDKYEIETLNNRVVGVGGEYQVDDIPYRKGCVVRTTMSDTTVEKMTEVLRSYLRSCSLDKISVHVSINGEPFNDHLYRGRRVRELSFGGVYVNRNGILNNHILFRVNGLTMFSRYINCGKQVVVEINPDRAREVLSANRNSFVGDALNEVNRWVDELSIDDISALRYRKRETRRIINGTGRLLMRSKSKQKEARQQVGKAGSTESITTEGRMSPFVSTMVEVSQEDMANRSYHEPMPGDRFAPDIFDVVILDETNDPDMDKVIARYHPENWTFEIKRDRGVDTLYRRGRESYRLLIAWKIAVEEALRVMVDVFNMDDIQWSVGWVFGWQGGCHTEIDGCHVFCLNPVEDMSAKYHLTRREDLLALLAIAKHEAAHGRVDLHNESWASTLTEIDKKYDTQLVLRRIKSELAALDV